MQNLSNITFSELENLTPIIETNMSYQSEITAEETREHEKRIAELTILIDNTADEINDLREIIKASVQERRTYADNLDAGLIDRVANTAVKFYDAENGTISIYVKEGESFKHIVTRDAMSSEVAKWLELQKEIKQTEIEHGMYRQKLQEIAGDGE